MKWQLMVASCYRRSGKIFAIFYSIGWTPTLRQTAKDTVVVLIDYEYSQRNFSVIEMNSNTR